MGQGPSQSVAMVKLDEIIFKLRKPSYVYICNKRQFFSRIRLLSISYLDLKDDCVQFDRHVWRKETGLVLVMHKMCSDERKCEIELSFNGKYVIPN